MKKFKCENGNRFGHYTVIDNTSVSIAGHIKVLVQCDCGKQALICLSDLHNEKIRGCRNCSAQDRGTKLKIGDKNKHWTIIDGPSRNTSNNIIWKVQCDCGTTRWMEVREFVNPKASFQCKKCAQKERGEKERIHNGGKIDFSINRLYKIKKSAEKRGLEFNVDLDYIYNLFEKQNHSCAITGDFIPDINKASLDRIDSSKGYIKGNVQWVTKQANLSKHIMSMSELLEFCKKVINHANQQLSSSSNALESSETNTRVLPGNAGDSNGDTSAKRVCRRDYWHGEIVRYFTEK